MSLPQPSNSASRHSCGVYSLCGSIVICAVFLLTAEVSAAVAEDGQIITGSAPAQSGECRLIGGMPAAELKPCFGEPDEISEEKTRQVWRYGDCELYVSDQKLIAWLNPEDLGNRRRMRAMARRDDKEYDPTDKAHWVNEWTPRKEVLPQEELLDLVGDEDETEPTAAVQPDQKPNP